MFVSIIVHTLLIIYVVKSYRPMAITPATAPIVHYVELMRQAPKQFVEAPGKKSETAPPFRPIFGREPEGDHAASDRRPAHSAPR